MTQGPWYKRCLSHPAATVAVYTDDGEVTYGELAARVEEKISALKAHSPCARPLVALEIANDAEGIVSYLASLNADYPLMLLSPSSVKAVREEAYSRFNPNLILQGDTIRVQSRNQHEMAEQLALLAGTSGSTGSAKFVALSRQNLIANTASILAFLPIENTDIALATLPFSYSYGLSVLNTHLAKGAAITLTQATVMDKAFWSLLTERPITSMAGVPSFYEMLLRLRLNRQALPALRYLTQAGGRLAPEKVKELATWADKNHKQFYVMYGQTEATARMAFLSPDKVLPKPHSVGQAIPGGEILLLEPSGDQISNPGEDGAVHYRGDNVMLGYCESSDELADFAPLPWLDTGDIGRFDEEGDLQITGRSKRFIKLFGERVSLDELERQLSSAGEAVACTGEDNLLIVACLTGQSDLVTSRLTGLISVPPVARRIIEVNSLPLLENGKVDYQSLRAIAASPSAN